MTQADEHCAFLSGQNVLYERQINGRLSAVICQTLDGGRAQFLSLVLYDNETERWIVLKLSTVRKIWKFLISKGFHEARRMTPWELAKCKLEEATREDRDEVGGVA